MENNQTNANSENSGLTRNYQQIENTFTNSFYPLFLLNLHIISIKFTSENLILLAVFMN